MTFKILNCTCRFKRVFLNTLVGDWASWSFRHKKSDPPLKDCSNLFDPSLLRVYFFDPPPRQVHVLVGPGLGACPGACVRGVQGAEGFRTFKSQMKPI